MHPTFEKDDELFEKVVFRVADCEKDQKGKVLFSLKEKGFGNWYDPYCLIGDTKEH